jgi:O-antigen ligase
MTSLAAFPGIDRARWLRVIDWLAVGVAVTLPWSTTATGIFIALWIVAVLPTLDGAALRRELSTFAGFLPVLLWILAAVGMLWADVPWKERLGGLGGFHKLLVIPLLFVHFRRSERGVWVLYGFLAGALALLAVSFGQSLVPGLRWRGDEIGVPTKDRIFQSIEFLVCAFALLGYAREAGCARRWRSVLGLVALALVFFADILFVVTGRTALLVAPVLLLLFGYREFRWKGLMGAVLIGCLVAVATWYGSPYLRDKLMTSVAELEDYRSKDAPNSTGLHMEFLRKSLLFVETAPVIGHGTGTIRQQFRNSLVGQDGASTALTDNPHNQIFAVGIQLGCVGVTVLLAMWVAHFILFVRAAPLTGWIGTIVVVQNVVSSLFNSHLFDFTSGWLYVFGVGVAGSMVLRQRDWA